MGGGAVTSDLDFAKEFSKRVHAGQVDKAGEEYWKHPAAVADLCSTDEEKIVAYLHDTVEDTDTTIDMIEKMFGSRIAVAVNYITHPQGMPYMDYIKRLAENDIAVRGKRADLRHNMDLSRLPAVTERDIMRVRKYQEAYSFLNKLENSGKRW